MQYLRMLPMPLRATITRIAAAPAKATEALLRSWAAMIHRLQYC
ncbi:MAG: hypothetical protein Q8Q09_25975 [Deltaproteobacteria bacterium]|nr:hypothetical protein [Deltaproteobacteria bacterium]